VIEGLDNKGLHNERRRRYYLLTHPEEHKEIN
jgi:hypothetical protein